MSPSRRHVDSARRLRVMTYNILLGARHRERSVMGVIERCAPDVLAMQEVTDLGFARRLARRLDMTLLVGRPSDLATDLHNVILTRLPVRRWKNHRHADSMLRSHLEAEIDVGAGDIGPMIRVHCLHLAARFGERANGEARRMRELDAILGDMSTLRDLPHVLVGDFNAVSPGDTLAASRFLNKMQDLRRAGVLVRGRDGLWGAPERLGEVDAELDALWVDAGVAPHLDVSVPRLPGALFALTRRVPRGKNVDRVMGRFIERWSVARILDAGYTDCYRRLHPRALGYTCSTWIPVSRVDYVFASPGMIPGLERCDVVGSRAWPDPGVLTASDHWPVVADFIVQGRD